MSDVAAEAEALARLERHQMASADRIGETQARLDTLLRQAGCTAYSAGEARRDAQECWRDILADEAAHGNSENEPFYSYVVTENAGVFTFFEPAIGIYVVPGDEWSFRSRFDALAMSDVELAKELLARHFGRIAPDLVIDQALSRAWLTAD
jgi:hypothetical protein